MATLTPKIGLKKPVPDAEADWGFRQNESFDILDDSILASNLLGSGTITILNDGSGNITISGSSTLQDAYDSGPEIIVSSDNEVLIKDNASPTTGNIFGIQDNSSTTILAVSSGVISAGQHIRPTGDQVQSIGTFANRFDKIHVGGSAYFIGGPGDATTVSTEGFGNMFVTVTDDTGTVNFGRQLGYADLIPNGSFLVGLLEATVAGATSEITVKNAGAFVGGTSKSNVSGYTSAVESTGYYSDGSFVWGYASGQDKNCYIRSGGAGSFTLGFAYGSHPTDGGGSVIVRGAYGYPGGFTVGAIYGQHAGNALISASRPGSFAQGFAYAPIGAGTGIMEISANGNGAFAQGYISLKHSGGGGCRILANGVGSFAQGYVYKHVVGTNGSSYIISGGKGSFAQGFVQNNSPSDGYIQATGDGSFARGFAYRTGSGDAVIQATAAGAFANGYALGGGGGAQDGHINAAGLGNVAMGYSNGGGTIEATGASNCFQFGQGINSEADSFQVGGDIRFKGTPGAPSTPQNGDMWVTSSGNTVIRSNGINQYI